jgi:hypothetical protein
MCEAESNGNAFLQLEKDIDESEPSWLELNDSLLGSLPFPLA